MNAKQYPLPDGWEITYCEEHDSVHDYIGRALSVRLALSDQDDYGLRVAELNKVVIKGHAVFMNDADDFHGDGEYEYFESEIVINPTWLDLCRVFHQQMEKTRDTYCSSLKGFRPAYYLDLKDVQCTIWGDFVDVPVYELVLGS